MILHPVETQVAKLSKHEELKITGAALKILLDSGFYKRAIGLNPGIHYRKEWNKGNFHLRVTKDGAYLHWDKWDPRRYPIRHILEVPELWKPLAKGTLTGAALGALTARQRNQGVLRGAAVGGAQGLSQTVSKLLGASS